MTTTNKKTGFIALISVIIISFILLLSAVTLNFTGFFGRFNVFDTELKEQSNALADACLERARLKLAQNEFFIGTIEEDIDGESCEYEVAAGGNIKTWAQVNGAHTYLKAKVNLISPEIVIIEFEECRTESTC